jgi:hypothetical protein
MNKIRNKKNNEDLGCIHGIHGIHGIVEKFLISGIFWRVISNIKFQVQIKIFKIKMLIFGLNNVF